MNQRPTHPAASPAPAWWALASAALVVLAIVLTYQGVTEGSYHFDDHPNITAWPSVHMADFSWTGLWEAGRQAMLPSRPLPYITFALDWWRGDGRPATMLATNLLIHVLNGLLALYMGYWLLHRGVGHPVRPAILAATVGALVWALHPIQVQGVAYVVQRMASLAHLFTLLALIGVMHAIHARGARRVVALVAAGLAALLGASSKETAWILPALAGLLAVGIVYHRRPYPTSAVARLGWLLPLLALVFVGIDILSQQGPLYRYFAPGYAGREFDLTERLLTQPRVLAMHAGQLLWPLPDRFALEHHVDISRTLLQPPSTLFALLGVLAYLAWGVRWLTRPDRRLHGALLLFVPLALAVESTIVPLELVFEHRLYLPSVAFGWLLALALAGPLARGGPGRYWWLAGCLAVLGGLAWSTAVRLPDWRTDYRLSEANVRTSPGSARAWMNFAVAQIEEQRFDAALESLNRSLAIDPDQPGALTNRGLLRARARGDGRAAMADFEQALRLAPTHYEALLARANLLRDLGRVDEALQGYRRVIALGQQVTGNLLSRVQAEHWQAVAHYQQGLLFARLGQTGASRSAYQAALALRPAMPEALFNLASTELAGGDPAAAAGLLDRYLAVKADDADAHFLRGRAALLSNDVRGAVLSLQRAVQMNPNDAEALETLGRTLLAAGDAAGGWAALRRACRLGRAAACAVAAD